MNLYRLGPVQRAVHTSDWMAYGPIVTDLSYLWWSYVVLPQC